MPFKIHKCNDNGKKYDSHKGTNARLYVSLNLTLLFNIDKANIMMNFD